MTFYKETEYTSSLDLDSFRLQNILDWTLSDARWR